MEIIKSQVKSLKCRREGSWNPIRRRWKPPDLCSEGWAAFKKSQAGATGLLCTPAWWMPYATAFQLEI